MVVSAMAAGPVNGDRLPGASQAHISAATATLSYHRGSGVSSQPSRLSNSHQPPSHKVRASSVGSSNGLPMISLNWLETEAPGGAGISCERMPDPRRDAGQGEGADHGLAPPQGIVAADEGQPEHGQRGMRRPRHRRDHDDQREEREFASPRGTCFVEDARSDGHRQDRQADDRCILRDRRELRQRFIGSSGVVNGIA